MVIRCGVDDSAPAMQAARGAAALAKRAGVDVELMYVQETLLPAGAGLAEGAAVPVAGPGLLEAESATTPTWSCPGAAGTDAAAALIGSTARSVARSSRRPVLLVPEAADR